MLHKIGLSKCNNDNLKYFSIYSSTEKLLLPCSYNSINNIISFMISYKILNINIMDFINFKKMNCTNHCILNISIEVNYKILYSSFNEETIQGLSHTSYYVIQIKLPCNIDGFSAKQLLSLNKLKAEIFIEDINVSIKNERTILITPYIIGNVLAFPDYSIAYIMEMDNGENNIFVSFQDGSRLKQKTFTKNIQYKNLCWAPFSSEIAYISNLGGKYSIYIQNTNNQNSYKLNLDLSSENIHSLCYISNSDIVFSSWNGENNDLYKINTRTNKLVKLTNSLNRENYINPKYSSVLNLIFFIVRKNDFDYLCSLNSLGLDLNYLSKKENILDFSLDCSCKYLIYYTSNICSNDETKNNSIYLLNISSLIEEEILLFEGAYNVKKIMFSPNSDIIALCVSEYDRDNIYFYFKDKYFSKNITNNIKDEYISDFTFNFLGDTLYYSCNQRGNYDVYTIDINSMHKKNLINCFSSNMTLFYKGL